MEATGVFASLAEVELALPNASFIGFTGTPLEKTDANMQMVFGDYIFIYEIERAISRQGHGANLFRYPHLQTEPVRHRAKYPFRIVSALSATANNRFLDCALSHDSQCSS